MLAIFKKATDEALNEIAEEMRVRKTSHFILLFSMGSQFDHLIVQQLSKLGVFAVVADPASVTADDVKKVAPAGIILSGGPASVHDEPPPFDSAIFDLGIPTLGVCLGFQMWATHVGAPVTPHEKREFGVHTFKQIGSDPLFAGIGKETQVLETHGDSVEESSALQNLGGTDNAPVAAGRHKHLWGVQFHPEVSDTVEGPKIYENFCVNICGITDRFPAHDVAKEKIEELKQKVGGPPSHKASAGQGKKVLIALSGGSDSSVVAYLLKEAGAILKGVYIRGIDRPDDEAYVKKYFGNESWIELEIADATDAFLEALKGQTTKIKLHHNPDLGLSVPELMPLETEVKDSARGIGRDIGVPEDLLVRHPFPGPGLLVRIEGEVTAENLRVARAVDGIYIEELRNADLYKTVWQAGATLTRSEHTVSKGDDAGMGHVVALWAVWSVNGFTTRFAQLPYDFLDKVSRRITNEVREVGAVVYRISDKPPATIEWG
jgi:GMP synthase (glutamine-hydrolysing)